MAATSKRTVYLRYEYALLKHRVLFIQRLCGGGESRFYPRGFGWPVIHLLLTALLGSIDVNENREV